LSIDEQPAIRVSVRVDYPNGTFVVRELELPAVAAADAQHTATRGVGPNPPAIVAAVASLYSIPVERLRDVAGSRSRRIANVRSLAATLLRAGGLSYAEIARELGYQEHSAAHAAVARHVERLAAGEYDALDPFDRLAHQFGLQLSDIVDEDPG